MLAGSAAAALLLAATLVHPAFAWLVGAPLLIGARGRPPGRVRAVLADVVLGVTFATSFAVVAHVPWLTEAAERYFALPFSTALAGATVLALGCGVALGALLGVLLAGVGTLRAPWSALALGAVWVAWEELARIGFPSYPWVALAATQADTPVVVQAASLAGQAGLSYVVATAGGAIGEAALAVVHRRPPWVALAVAATLVAGVVCGGVLRLRAAAPAPRDGCTLAAVDARIPSGDLAAGAALARHVAASEAVLALAPDVLVWPESALPRDPRLERETLATLQRLAREKSLVLIAGAPRVAWDPAWRQRVYNSLYVVAPDGTVRTYDKRAPVAIAERWPFAWIARPAALEVVEVAPGAAPALISAGSCRVGVLICSETEDPALARELALGGAAALVVATNDAPLPERAVATEVAQARLRAVETGLPVLRAANAGTSLAIDRYARTLPRVDGAVVLPASEPPRLAPATRWAPPFRALCALTALVTGIAGARARARREPSAGA